MIEFFKESFLLWLGTLFIAGAIYEHFTMWKDKDKE